MYNELKDLGYMFMWALTAAGIIAWFIHEIKQNAQDRYYWLGRKDGWDMHRRMIDNKVKTDEVFDYDKH